MVSHCSMPFLSDDRESKGPQGRLLDNYQRTRAEFSLRPKSGCHCRRNFGERQCERICIAIEMEPWSPTSRKIREKGGTLIRCCVNKCGGRSNLNPRTR